MVKRALIYSVVSEGLTSLCMLVTFRLASEQWGAQGLSEWVLARRVFGLLLPAVTLGLETSLTLACSNPTPGVTRDVGTLFASAVIPVALIGALLSVLSGLFPGTLAAVFFGDGSYAQLQLPTALITASLGMHLMVVSYLRGTMRFLTSSVLHFVTLGALPLLVLVVLNLGARETLLVLAATIVGAVSLVAFLRPPHGFQPSEVRPTMRKLLGNSLPRVPAALGLLALFGLPPIFVAHIDGLENAAFLSMGLSIVTLAGSIFSPVATVLLPVVARARRLGNGRNIAEKLRVMWPVSMLIGVIAAVTAFAGAEVLANVLLGHGEPKLVRALHLAAWAMVPYIYFICARPVVDAHASSSTITRQVIIAVAVFVAAFALLHYVFDASALDSALLSHVASILALALAASFHLRPLLARATPDAGDKSV